MQWKLSSQWIRQVRRFMWDPSESQEGSNGRHSRFHTFLQAADWNRKMAPALCRNLNLKPTQCSPISTKLLKPISRSSHSHELLCLNRLRSEKWSALIMPCALYKPNFGAQHVGTHEQLIRPLVKGLFGFAAAATTLLSVCCDSPPAFAEPLTVVFPVSRTSEPEVIFISFFFFILVLLIYI